MYQTSCLPADSAVTALQQAPAIGRANSEHILFGEYRSLDLSPLAFERLSRNEPLLEQNVI